MDSLVTRPPLPPLCETFVDGEKFRGCNVRELLVRGIRSNNRKLIEVRPLSMHLDILAGASGSAYIKQGNTKIITAIYGPLPSNKTSEHDKGTISLELFIAPHNGKAASTKERELKEKYIKRKLLEAIEPLILLGKYPRAEIDIFVTIIEDDGGALTSTLTCIGLALVDASIHVTDIIVGASTYAIFDKPQPLAEIKPIYAVDFDLEEEAFFELEGGCTSLHIGHCLGRSGICFLHSQGSRLSLQHIEKMLSIGESACHAIGAEIQEYLRKRCGKEKKREDILKM